MKSMRGNFGEGSKHDVWYDILRNTSKLESILNRKILDINVYTKQHLYTRLKGV